MSLPTFSPGKREQPACRSCVVAAQGRDRGERSRECGVSLELMWRWSFCSGPRRAMELEVTAMSPTTENNPLLPGHTDLWLLCPEWHSSSPGGLQIPFPIFLTHLHSIMKSPSPEVTWVFVLCSPKQLNASFAISCLQKAVRGLVHLCFPVERTIEDD